MFNFLFEGKIGEILAPVTGSNQLYLAIQHHKNSEVLSLIDSSSSYNLSQLSDGGVAAIHIACRYNNTFALDLILKQGVAVDLKDSVGNTPLHYASKYGHFEICKTLISRGCSPVSKNGSNQSPYDITESHVIRQYLLPLQFQSEREQQQQQYPGPGQQQLGISTGGGYGYGNEVSGSNYDPYNNQGIMPLGVSGANSYSLPQQQQQLPPPSPHGGQQQQQMTYNNFNTTSNLPQPPAFNSLPTNVPPATANQQQSPPQRNSFDNNQQQPIQIQTQNQAPLVTIPSAAAVSSAAASVVPPPPSMITTSIVDTTMPLASVGSSFIPPSPKSNTSATTSTATFPSSSASAAANTNNQQPGNRIFMPDGFHSSASDPALQLKYGHVKAAVNIAPPPTGMPAMSGTGSVGGVSPYSMYSNNNGVGSAGINNYSLAAVQQLQPVTSALAPIASRYVGYDAHTNQAVNVNAYTNFNNNNISNSPTHASTATNSFYPPTQLSAPVPPPSVMSVAPPPMPSTFSMMSPPSMPQTSHITISPPTQQSQSISPPQQQSQLPMISVPVLPPFFQPPSVQPLGVQTQQPVSVPPQASTTAAVQQQQQFQPLVKVFNPATDSSAEVVSLSANSKAIL